MKDKCPLWMDQLRDLSTTSALGLSFQLHCTIMYLTHAKRTSLSSDFARNLLLATNCMRGRHQDLIIRLNRIMSRLEIHVSAVAGNRHRNLTVLKGASPQLDQLHFYELMIRTFVS